MSELEQRETKYRRLNYTIAVVYVAVGCYSLVSAIRHEDSYAASQAVLGLLMLFTPALLRLLRVNIPQDCRTLYYVFVFCTVIVGSSLYGYSKIPYWDKLFHFLSGLLISAAGLIVCHMLFRTISGPKPRVGLLYLVFPFLFNAATAVLWEVYEYALYIFFGVDAVNTLTTGVNDTMQDMIVCLAGGLLFTGSIARLLRKGKRSYLLKVCYHFFALRGQTLDLENRQA